MSSISVLLVVARGNDKMRMQQNHGDMLEGHFKWIASLPMLKDMLLSEA